MKEFLNEFKKFALKGNVIDLAVGVVIGAAFGKIVETGGINFTGLSVSVGEATIPYGKFIQAVVAFSIIAFTLFIVIKAINKLKRKEEASIPPPKRSPEAELLTEIRDLLKSK